MRASAPLSFTAPGSGPPLAATLMYPNGVITDSTPTYTWNAVPTATWYYLWVTDASGIAVQNWYSAGAAGCAGGTGTCSVTPGTAVTGSVTWWVQTWNSSGYGPWSAGMPFRVGSHVVTLEYGTAPGGPRLYGAVLDVGVAYTIYADVSPTSDVASVDFYLDGAFVNTEVGAPYEMVDQTWSAPGSHTVVAEVEYTGGGSDIVSAPFTVG